MATNFVIIAESRVFAKRGARLVFCVHSRSFARKPWPNLATFLIWTIHKTVFLRPNFVTAFFRSSNRSNYYAVLNAAHSSLFSQRSWFFEAHIYFHIRFGPRCKQSFIFSRKLLTVTEEVCQVKVHWITSRITGFFCVRLTKFGWTKRVSV